MGLFSSDPATHFPLVTGRTLDGDDVRFPQDLPADATLLIVYFQDDLDPLADQWARLGERMAEPLDGRLAVVETPVVGRTFKLLGDLGTMGIRGQVDDEAEHARTVPLYVDTKVFRKTLSIKTGDVYAFLLARDGRIAWRGEGAIDMDEIHDLEAAVADVLAAPIPAPTDHPDLDAEADDAEPEADAPKTEGEAPEVDSSGTDGEDPSAP
ncbi:hypothetical protein B1759_01600 [Rubrivirga sp. SAORIC476]|uniref:hypothetical protein n=1 Tax=Rubrivirga sp. SAORIC476 TaxID=1961794 RepID=UPI000BA8FAB9|nr:hypothetical protein [Rubrivirga sp. SAORIC476]PAP82473.1 hypothetical protein B1759_01600 [Rubrivirga sp. SAORIC476]